MSLISAVRSTYAWVSGAKKKREKDHGKTNGCGAYITYAGWLTVMPHIL